jgi:hypothetical protein
VFCLQIIAIGVQECNFHLSKDVKNEYEARRKSFENRVKTARDRKASSTPELIEVKSNSRLVELFSKQKSKTLPSNHFDSLIQASAVVV